MNRFSAGAVGFRDADAVPPPWLILIFQAAVLVVGPAGFRDRKSSVEHQGQEAGGPVVFVIPLAHG